MKPLDECTEAEIKHTKKMKDAKGVKFAAENASSKVCMIPSAREKLPRCFHIIVVPGAALTATRAERHIGECQSGRRFIIFP